MILNKISLGLLFTVLVCSCSVFTVKDITKSPVILYSPVDGIKTYTQTQTFWWSPVDEADGYNLLIVSPRFDSIASLIADTNVVGNKFMLTLAPGKYEWSVSAYNSGYSTYKPPIFSLTVTIDSTNNLNNQTIVLSSPADYADINKTTILFKWVSMNMATYYIVSVRDSVFGTEYFGSRTNYDTISFTLPEGKYTWGVQGHNDLTQTNFSKRSLIVDTTAPGIPIITVPANDGDTINTSPYLIEWEHSKGSLSPISDNIYVATDSLFKNNNTSYTSTTLEQSVSDLTNDKFYFVKIRSFDLAGNMGGFCRTHKFFLHKQ